MEVSIVVAVYNEEQYIERCLSGLLDQTFTNFELFLIDDNSTDSTPEIIKKSHDPRIKYIKNEKHLGIAESHNAGLRQAKGKYIFFTNADCKPTKYWLEEGLRAFKENECLAVMGRTFYATAKTTISDRIIESLSGNEYRTCNIAYTKEIIEKVGFFRPEYEYLDDADLALRVKTFGSIVFSENMIVVHQQKIYTVKRLFQDAEKTTEALVRFIKDHPNYQRSNTDLIWGKIVFPKKFLIIFFPFFLLAYHSFRSRRDFAILPFIYLAAIYLRFRIWKSAVKEKIFLI